MRVIIRTVALGSIVAMITACGGSQPPASEPGASSEESAGSKEADETEQPSDDSSEAPKTGSPGDEKKDAAGSEKKEAEATPKMTGKDVITKPGVLYVFSFPDSEPHQVAEKKCKEGSHDDPKKMADCMTKASKQVEQDSMSFEEDGEGKLWWLTVQRKGDVLVTVHKIPFEVGEDSGKKVTIKPHGPDTGKKPMGAIPRELTIEIDGESQIAIDNPKLGRLVYQAKLGLLGNQER